jgi:hypothetical protein
MARFREGASVKTLTAEPAAGGEGARMRVVG